MEPRLWILTVSLFMSSLTIAEPMSHYIRMLEYEPVVKQWVTSINPDLSESDQSVIANHVLFNAGTKGLPLDLLIGLIMVESRFDAKARSSHGAKGLTQVVPKWHRDKIRGRNIFDVRVNLEVGTQVLLDCMERAKGVRTKALNCYTGYKGKLATKYQRDVAKYSAQFKQFFASNHNGHLMLALADK